MLQIILAGRFIPGILLVHAHRRSNHPGSNPSHCISSTDIPGICYQRTPLRDSSPSGKQRISKTAGSLYSADLAGSAAGALIMAIVMIPLLGLYGSLAMLLILNLLAALTAGSGGRH